MPDALRHLKWWHVLIAVVVTLMLVGAVARDGDQGAGGQTPVTAPSPAGDELDGG